MNNLYKEPVAIFNCFATSGSGTMFHAPMDKDWLEERQQEYLKVDEAENVIISMKGGLPYINGQLDGVRGIVTPIDIQLTDGDFSAAHYHTDRIDEFVVFEKVEDEH